MDDKELLHKHWQRSVQNMHRAGIDLIDYELLGELGENQVKFKYLAPTANKTTNVIFEYYGGLETYLKSPDYMGLFVYTVISSWDKMAKEIMRPVRGVCLCDIKKTVNDLGGVCSCLIIDESRQLHTFWLNGGRVADVMVYDFDTYTVPQVRTNPSLTIKKVNDHQCRCRSREREREATK